MSESINLRRFRVEWGSVAEPFDCALCGGPQGRGAEGLAVSVGEKVIFKVCATCTPDLPDELKRLAVEAAHFKGGR